IPAPIPSYNSDGIDAGYPFQDVVADGNGYMYGPTGYGSYSMGYQFKPLKSGMISKLGRYRGSYSENSTVKLWDKATSAQLASATVGGTNWSYVDITPVSVDAGKSYFVTTYGGSYVYYWYQNTYPVDKDDITLEHGAYASGDACPTYDGGGYFYGCADVFFEPVPSTETWTGAADDDWGQNGNWDGGHAPALGITVTIPGGCALYPASNSLASYGCKDLKIGSGASLTVVSGKPLTNQGDFENSGTFQVGADVNISGGLTNMADGVVTVEPGLMFKLGKGLYNAGTFTNGGNVFCGGDFSDYGTFTSGLYSELHLTGPDKASFVTGVADAPTGFYDLFMDKVKLNVKVGDSAYAGGSYYSGSGYTFLCDQTEAISGDIVSWKCYAYNTGTTRLRIYRPGYNGYTWGLVNQGEIHSIASGINSFTETITGLEAGDKIGAFSGNNIAFGYSQSKHMLMCFADADPGSNSWSDYGYGPYGLQGIVEGPAGAVTSTGDVTIDGDLNIAVENNLVIDGPGDWTCTGMWTDNGAFHPGAGSVTFDGETRILGTAAPHMFNNVTLTGTLFGPSTAMTVNGNWLCSGTFYHGYGTATLNGTITSGGQSFFDVNIDNPTDGNVTILDDIKVERNLTLTSGTFLLGAHQLTVGTSAASGKVEVNFPAVFSVVGTGASAKGTVTAATAGRPYSFTVNDEGKIAAKFANFTWMGANGIDIQNGAHIDATNNFSSTSFTAGNNVGTMLKIATTQNIDDIVLTNFNGTGGYNIDYAAGTGHLTVTGGGGARWGEAFDNDPNNKVDWVSGQAGDIAVTKIIAPVNSYLPNTEVTPKATWKNNGTTPMSFTACMFLTNPTGTRVYTQSHDTLLDGGQSVDLTFDPYTVVDLGNWAVKCSTVAAGDNNPANDWKEGTFTVGETPPPPPGWAEATSVPVMPSGRAVKDGACLAYDAGTDVIYASKGYKTGDFYKYEYSANAWTILASVPFGGDGKQVYKGSVICADGNGKLYLVKGNNTNGFWEYDAATDVWAQKSDIPYGESGKRVKQGSGIAWAGGAAYLLKGYRNEFYKYDPASGEWVTLTPAPVGWHMKWDAGSWLVSDGDHTLYAFKGKYHEFYTYDTETGA
ncbi:MAG: DUF4082 domain-containing protein, partial [candidate division WOR-3 bacterium]|nr:DUF4082 domain-containing protein [candidate division WOR-3 bacterium]